MSKSHFSIKNIPFGIGSSSNHPARTVVTRFEDTVIFLDELAKIHAPLLSKETIAAFSCKTVNDFAALPRAEQSLTRKWIQSIIYKSFDILSPSCTSAVEATTLHLPLAVGDFTDFSCSRDHVLNAGEAVFGNRELPPGFEHFPVGYHGRSSSIVISGTPIRRPKGQYRDASGKVIFGPTNRLDYELEVAAVIGAPSQLGEPVTIGNADEHIFGLVLLNDWSGEDLDINQISVWNANQL
jgi:fumarylacetoacetase